jgi:hypothetical protein
MQRIIDISNVAYEVRIFVAMCWAPCMHVYINMRMYAVVSEIQRAFDARNVAHEACMNMGTLCSYLRVCVCVYIYIYIYICIHT